MTNHTTHERNLPLFKIPTVLGVTIATVLFGVSSAQAGALYCHNNRIRTCLGCSTSTTMTVVVNTVPRKAPLGVTRGTGCGLSFYSTSGFYKPIDVLEQPHIGTVKSGRYGVTYSSAKVGTDQFAFVLHQASSRTGEAADTKVTVDVNVVAEPF